MKLLANNIDIDNNQELKQIILKIKKQFEDYEKELTFESQLMSYLFGDKVEQMKQAYKNNQLQLIYQELKPYDTFIDFVDKMNKRQKGQLHKPEQQIDQNQKIDNKQDIQQIQQVQTQDTNKSKQILEEENDQIPLDSAFEISE